MEPQSEATTSEAGSAVDATVVVVGAGLSGLTAARELRRRGVDVVVLEAAERVGGRTMSETSALGSRLDVGGQWIGHDHHRVTRLADELGLTPFPMHTGPLPKVVHGPRRLPVLSPPMVVAGLVLAVVGLLTGLGRLGRSDRWNDRTVASWLGKVPGRTARRLLEVVAAASWTADLDRFSVAAMIAMIRSQGGLRTILSTKGGAQESLVVEGVGTLAERIAAELGPSVQTGQRVTSLRRDDHGVTVRTPSQDLRAAKVIVSVPPPVAARITHQPPLPPGRAEVEQHTYMGSVYKAIAVYDEPFWRRDGRGELIVLDHPGTAVFDSSPPGGPGHLCLLVGGPDARALDHLDVTERRNLLLGPLATHIGPGVLAPSSWHERSWHLDEHAGGGYVSLPEPGRTSGFPPVPATPVGPIHWAGAETANDHPGYLDGAIEAGHRAAAEVIEGLARPQPPPPDTTP